tara:strand:- start:197 stop:1699 length:1503 start_codon:yes stop_codon:yes gene_type:complete
MSSDNGGIIGVVNDPTSTTASGVWQQEEQYEAKVNDTWPQRPLFTTKSLRFNDGSSDYLIRTPSSASNKDLWTLSFWIKRSTLGTSQSIYGVYADSNNQETLAFDSNDKLYWQLYQSGGVVGQLTTNRLFRDTSAWYHIVVAYDSANSTAGNRMRMYINGVEETSFATDTNPSSGQDSQWNSTTAHSIGRINTTNYVDLYMTEFVNVDGQALAPTSFGVANSDGVWTPIPYTGTFGTNGFNLQFEDSSSLGTDSSANGNNFTVNNLTSIDQSTDYPVVNFATWNPLENYYQSNTYSEGNLQVQTQNTSFTYNFATIGVSTGKWYWEVEYDAKSGGTDQPMIGITSTQPTANDNELGNFPNDFAWYTDNGTGYLSNNNTYSNVGFTAYTVGDVISVALDLDNNKLYFAKNGTWEKSGNPESGSTGTGAISITATASTPLGAYFPSVGDATNSYNATFKTNFGSPPYSISSGNADGNGYGNFEYAVPSGYYSLNTANLAEFG